MAKFIAWIVNVVQKVPFLKKWFLKESKKEDEKEGQVDPNRYTLH